MKKKYTFTSYSLLFYFLCALFLLPACQSARLARSDANKSENFLTEAQMTASAHENLPQEPAFVQASAATHPSEDMPAAASTQADLSAVEITTLVHPATPLHDPVARTTKPVTQEEATTSGQTQKKLSLPARMLLKKIVKKAEKIQKKDITHASQQKEVNSSGYLILGLLLLAAGLALVIVGNTNFLLILGAISALVGLVFFLLAIL